MIHRDQFTFTSRQQEWFYDVEGIQYPPLNSAVLEGPVIQMSVRLGNHLVTHEAQAMIDTGSDTSTVVWESLYKWCNDEQVPPPLIVHPVDLLDGFLLPSVSFIVPQPGATPQTSAGRLLFGGTVRVLSRRKVPGYEDILLGRDVLNRYTLCMKDKQFSLIDPRTSLPIACCG